MCYKSLHWFNQKETDVQTHAFTHDEILEEGSLHRGTLDLVGSGHPAEVGGKSRVMKIDLVPQSRPVVISTDVILIASYQSK